VQDIPLTIESAGMINGEVVIARGEGLGSVQSGTLAMKLEFSKVPQGWSVFCASLWTARCSTPTFVLERDGGKNMVNIAKGRYRCQRTFDFGPYGGYEYDYEIRLQGENMRATGALKGNLHLPEIVSVDPTFTEIMVPVNPLDIRSFASTSFTAEDGVNIPISVTGRYSPLASDGEDWHCCTSAQLRQSFIDIHEAADARLSLDYRTVISGIHAPELTTT
jgi:hypothetical protein